MKINVAAVTYSVLVAVISYWMYLGFIRDPVIEEVTIHPIAVYWHRDNVFSYAVGEDAIQIKRLSLGSRTEVSVFRGPLKIHCIIYTYLNMYSECDVYVPNIDAIRPADGLGRFNN